MESWIRELIAAGNLHAFYASRTWVKLRAEVLTEDKYECQRCKSRGYYARANTVHHARHVRKYPELALSKTYIDEQGKEKRNLISLCRDCHEEAHGFRRQQQKSLTEERW